MPRPRRAPPGVRPTSARVRDALFNSLGDWVAGRTVLDLFAGTGALGLEALARGAREAIFVERDRRLVEGIHAALAKEGWADRAEVWRKDALGAVRELSAQGRAFDLILMDPPYGQAWIPRILRALAGSGVLRTDGLIVAEGHWRDLPPAEPGFMRTREARYGETALWFYVSQRGEEA